MKQQLKTVNIKGVPYVEVNTRLKYFNETYKGGSVTTEILSDDGESVVMKTTVIPDVTVPERKFTGIACEKRNDGYINKTSHYENCETSSVGRALGMMGIGIDSSVASADEVREAISQQEYSDVVPNASNLTDDEVLLFELPQQFKKFKGLTLNQILASKAGWDYAEYIVSKTKDEHLRIILNRAMELRQDLEDNLDVTEIQRERVESMKRTLQASSDIDRFQNTFKKYEQEIKGIDDETLKDELREVYMDKLAELKQKESA